MHPGAAARGDAERAGLFGGVLNGAGNLLADHGAHGAAHKTKVNHSANQRLALDGACAGDHTFRKAGGLLGLLVLLSFRENSGIGGGQSRVNLVKTAFVQQTVDVLGADAKVVIALGAHVQILAEFFMIYYLIATVALDPQPVGDIPFSAGSCRVPSSCGGRTVIYLGLVLNKSFSMLCATPLSRPMMASHRIVR